MTSSSSLQIGEPIRTEPHYVYILSGFMGDKNVLYVGLTKDIDRRLKEHLSGRSTYTSRLHCMSLLGYTQVGSLGEAMKLEHHIKRSGRKKKLEYAETWNKIVK